MEWKIVDVEAWLSTLPRGTLDKWLAFDSVEPIGEQRLQTAEITALLHRLTAYTLATQGNEMAPIDIDGYMPPRYLPEPKLKPKKTKPVEQFKQVAALMGLGKVAETK